VDQMDEMRDRIARLDATIERAKSLPSWPTMAARLERLTQAIETLTARVEALEQESIPLMEFLYYTVLSRCRRTVWQDALKG
jgi:archaellum component FlaC